MISKIDALNYRRIRDIEQPIARGTRPNLLRMRQFYEAYRSNPSVSPLVRLFAVDLTRRVLGVGLERHR